MADLRAALFLKPDVQTRMDMASALYKSGDPRGAVAQLRQVLADKADSADALGNLAWLLATSADDRVRGGAEAVQCAERACRLTEFKQSRLVGTLAAAYAEVGRFPEAAAAAEKALQVETAQGETPFAASIRYLLANYKAGRAWHEPPP
jgi:Flp pilus assembly protein TadD